jgi:hypothetical protein
VEWSGVEWSGAEWRGRNEEQYLRLHPPKCFLVSKRASSPWRSMVYTWARGADGALRVQRGCNGVRCAYLCDLGGPLPAAGPGVGHILLDNLGAEGQRGRGAEGQRGRGVMGRRGGEWAVGRASSGRWRHGAWSAATDQRQQVSVSQSRAKRERSDARTATTMHARGTL